MTCLYTKEIKSTGLKVLFDCREDLAQQGQGQISPGCCTNPRRSLHKSQQGHGQIFAGPCTNLSRALYKSQEGLEQISPGSYKEPQQGFVQTPTGREGKAEPHREDFKKVNCCKIQRMHNSTDAKFKGCKIQPMQAMADGLRGGGQAGLPLLRARHAVLRGRRGPRQRQARHGAPAALLSSHHPFPWCDSPNPTSKPYT